MTVERAVMDVPLNWQPGPISMLAPGPKVRRRTGWARAAAVARRQDEMRLAPAPMLMRLPGQRSRPTGPWADTPAPTCTPRAMALRRRRRVPQNAPFTRMICKHR